MYNIVMKKKILTLFLCLIYLSFPVFAADSLKGGMEQTDAKGNINK